MPKVEPKHTSPPWFKFETIDGYTGIMGPITPENKPHIAWVDFAKEEDLQIALAAPDMLEALEKVQQRLKECCQFVPEYIPAAIKKARGIK